MSRRIKLTQRIQEVKWVTVRYTDGVINLVEGRHIENVDTGESMIEADSLKVGDDCSARYGDGHMYPAEILHVTGDKTLALKYKAECAKEKGKSKKAKSDTDDKGNTKQTKGPKKAKLTKDTQQKENILGSEKGKSKKTKADTGDKGSTKQNKGPKKAKLTKDTQQKENILGSEKAVLARDKKEKKLAVAAAAQESARHLFSFTNALESLDNGQHADSSTIVDLRPSSVSTTKSSITSTIVSSPTPIPTPTPVPVHHAPPSVSSPTPVHHAPPSVSNPTPVHHAPPSVSSPTPVHHAPPSVSSPTPVHHAPPSVSSPTPVHHAPPSVSSHTPVHHAPPSVSSPTPVHHAPPSVSSHTPVHHAPPSVSSPTPVHHAPPSVSSHTPVHHAPPSVSSPTPVHHAPPSVSSPTPVHHAPPSVSSPTPVHHAPPSVSSPTPVHHAPPSVSSPTPVHHAPPSVSSPTPVHHAPPSVSTTKQSHPVPFSPKQHTIQLPLHSLSSDRPSNLNSQNIPTSSKSFQFDILDPFPNQNTCNYIQPCDDPLDLSVTELDTNHNYIDMDAEQVHSPPFPEFTTKSILAPESPQHNTVSGYFSSLLSGECEQCVVKDGEIERLLHVNRCLQQKLDESREVQSQLITNTVPSKKGKKTPRADWAVLKTGERPVAGHQFLVDGLTVSVPTAWFVSFMAKNRKKVPASVIKGLMDSGLNPWQYGLTGGRTALEDSHPDVGALIRAMEAFAAQRLSMTPSEFTRAVNEKMAAGRSTMKKIA